MKLIQLAILATMLIAFSACDNGEAPKENADEKSSVKKEQSDSEKPKAKELDDPSELIIGDWTIESFEFDFDYSIMSEQEKAAYEANKEMIDLTMERMKVQARGKIMSFEKDGTTQDFTGEVKPYRLLEDGKQLQIGSTSSNPYEIVSISANRMTLTRSDSGKSLKLDLSK